MLNHLPPTDDPCMYLCLGTRQLRTLHFLEAALVFCISRGRVSHTDCKAWQASCSERRL